MKVLYSLEELSQIEKPVFLTIGNFDGVHPGHQIILKNLKDGAKLEQVASLVITFSNHPSQILRPNHPTPLLTSKEHKFKLLEQIGIDYVLMLDFTLPFSEQSAEIFLRQIYKNTPFRRLILGSDAKLGNDRQGNTPLMHEIANRLHFSLDFLPLVPYHQKPITSSRIRLAIQNADLKTAEELLGRKVSIMGKVMHGRGDGHILGYPTLNLSLENLCHPPFGVYAVTVLHDNHKYPGVANLGIAPTMRTSHTPLLETYLLNQTLNLYDQTIEVVFEDFFRPEKVFESPEALKEQIAADIHQATSHFNLL